MDQSVYGDSQMSFVGGESQISGFSGTESSFSSRDQEDSGHIITTVLVAIFCMLIVVICSGVVLAFFIGDSEQTTEGIAGARSGVGSGGSGGTSGGASDRSNPNAATGGISGSEPSTMTTTKRSGLMFCVVGENFVSETPIVSGWCDYAIYPDLVAVNGRFQPLYGQSSWNAFEKAIASQPNFAPGVSFWNGAAADANSTVSQIPNMHAQLQDLVLTKRVRAMGLLNFARHASSSTHTLERVFKTLDDALQGQTDLKAMTFLGVWLYSHKTAMDFVSEVVALNANLTTVILQTHISELYTTSTTCISRPICVKSSASDLPSFSIAEAVVSALRAQGDRFRLMFSSTLGAMVYMGAENDLRLDAPNKPCELSYMVDFDLVCNNTLQIGVRSYNRIDKYAYILFRENKRLYYATYETVESIYDKYEMYIQDISDGWALFEIQRDAATSCASTQLHYDRLEAAQGPARTRLY